MSATSIQWTDHSINPIRARMRGRPGAVGHYCEKISPGCKNCYASALQPCFKMPPFSSGHDLSVVRPFLDETKLLDVIGRRKPTKFFWCDMSDLFGEWVQEEWIDLCFAAIVMTPWHTHQVLTKRSGRMCDYFAVGQARLAYRWGMATAKLMDLGMVPSDHRGFTLSWPVKAWLGISAENQHFYNRRIDHLLDTPAAVRFVSAEPLLGYIGGFRGVDWVIFGGESGRSARPCEVNWITAALPGLQRDGIAAYVKQLGAKPYLGGLEASTPGDLRSWAFAKKRQVEPDDSIAIKLKDPKGGDPAEWPEFLRVREFPVTKPEMECAS